MVPYAESSGFMKGFKSLYYNESHKSFKIEIRKFFKQHVK